MRFPLRAPIAIVATLGLLAGMAAIPVTADSHQVCTPQGQSAGSVADGVTISYDSLFVCADAAASGLWSITVEVENDEASTGSLTLDSAELTHTSPSPLGTSPSATAATGDLPVTIDPGESASIVVEGEYELVSTDDGDAKAILHLRLSGTAADDTVHLAANVQLLAPGVDPDLDDTDTIDEDNGDGEGRPEWVPGPPPWVIDLLRAIFADGFPWGSDTFPPSNGDHADENEDEGAENGDAPAGMGRPSWAGPPSGIPGPGTGGDDEDDEGDEDDGPPSFVTPGGPPHTIPGPGRP
ncbi:MAG TPA: hypothetical protein VLA76_01740 [Candidatus Angelobacter sp.]|nr:hypothetical protein [Candidatus Angelobacter sp.]